MGRPLATGSWRKVRLWDVNTGNPLRTLTGHTDSVYSVSFEVRMGQTLATGSGDATVRPLGCEHGGSLSGRSTEHTSPILSVSFRSGGSEPWQVAVWTTRCVSGM